MSNMVTKVLSAGDATAVQQAAKALDAGQLVAFPTDTVYGVAALPWQDRAVEGLYVAKERPREKPIPLLLADGAALERVAHVDARCQNLVEAFWPGALTLVVAKRPTVSDAVSPRPTVAVRVPGLPLARRIIAAAGGVLAVTSANMSGRPSPVTADDVECQLGGRIALIVDGGPCSGGSPSTILDCSVVPPRLLRRGGVTAEALHACIGSFDSLDEESRS